ncbi:hypothetical protein QJS10_CPB19g01406 [Acorus calamus]|uniref:PLATZ transcription factor family protein n=1 Tax=Acorus calamus TaxID=4465 RepID=A0AAV9CFW5_ACOCL|nr:hypothetical protein QJS10_CPB19g01406 [Acorus calamus]
MQEKLWPPWLTPLLSTQFFIPCKYHNSISSKSECNMYCLDCTNGPLCSSCLIQHHPDHHAIQIRRSSYHDVIRVSDVQKVLDISGVQTYVINGWRVVFLNKRPQPPRLGRGAVNACVCCGRSLIDGFAFCSLGCKLARTTSVSPPHCPVLVRSSASKSANVFRKRRKGVPHRASMGD